MFHGHSHLLIGLRMRCACPVASAELPCPFCPLHVMSVQVKAASESRNGDQGGSVLGGNAAYNAKMDEHMKEQQQQLEAAQAALSAAQQAEGMIRCFGLGTQCIVSCLPSAGCDTQHQKLCVQMCIVHVSHFSSRCCAACACMVPMHKGGLDRVMLLT